MESSFIFHTTSKSRRRFRRPLGVGALYLAATLIGGPPATHAETVATGSYSVSIDTTWSPPPFPLTGTVTFDDATFVVPGSAAPDEEVNLGILVGTMNVTGTVTQAFGIPGETGQVVAQAYALPQLYFDAEGDFICPGPTGCTGTFNSAWIEDVFNLAGFLVMDGTLPLDAPNSVAYKQDGDSSCTSLLDLLGYTIQVDCTGPLGWNVFFAVATPEGTDVTVSTSTSYFNPITQTELPVDAEVTYAEVPPGGGATMVTATSSAAGEVDPDFAVAAGEFHVAFFDVSTDFTPEGPISICSYYPDEDSDGIVDGTDAGGEPGVHECMMRILHDEGGEFVDSTTLSEDAACVPSIPSANLCPGSESLCIDRVNNRICAKVDSLSVLGVFPPAPEPLPALGPWALALLVVGIFWTGRRLLGQRPQI